jgi:hypothetical protein
MHGALEVRQRADQQKHGDYLEVTGFDKRPVPDARGDKNAFSHTFEPPGSKSSPDESDGRI